MRADAAMRVEIYVDLACPWSYMGKRHFEWAVAAFERKDEVDVILRPYLAEAVRPTDAVTDASVRVAASGGIDYRPDRVVPTDTLVAQRLIWLATRERGSEVARQVMDRIFLAYFTEGRDISDIETLADIGRRSGIDERRVRELGSTEEGVTEVRDQLGQSRERGIAAVPTLVFGNGRVLVGAHDSLTYLDVLEELATDKYQRVTREGLQVSMERACA
jgi:predicted DsbA family dithiol-disulfide isomerase